MAIISSGILLPIDATIRNDYLRHIVVKTFIFPTHWLFNLPSWRLLTSKDSVPLMSNAFIAPLALFGSALVWALIVSAAVKTWKGQKLEASATEPQKFWKLSFSSSGALSILLFLLLVVSRYRNLRWVSITVSCIDRFFSIGCCFPSRISEPLTRRCDTRQRVRYSPRVRRHDNCK